LRFWRLYAIVFVSMETLMQRSTTILFAIATLLCSAPAVSAYADSASDQTSSTSASAAAKPAHKDDADEMVCHREPEPGSRLGGTKECHTRREWAQISADSREDLTNVQTRSGQTTPLAGK
jgi:hypothetical protein